MCWKRLFKPKVINVDTVYTNIVECPMWCNMYKEYKTPITTKVIRFVREDGSYEFKVEQFYSPIYKPFYDGEYSSNRALETSASEEKERAKIWLLNEHNYIIKD